MKICWFFSLKPTKRGDILEVRHVRARISDIYSPVNRAKMLRPDKALYVDRDKTAGAQLGDATVLTNQGT